MTTSHSDKHNPRIDDSMADHDRSFLHGAPVDSRVEERFRDEGPGPRPGQASADSMPEQRGPGTSEGMKPLDVARRSELASYIEGSVFPADRQALLESAAHMQAPPAVIDLIERLPADEQFEHMEEVWEAAQS